jgi:hypothetical protein
MGLAIASFVLALLGCCAGIVPMIMSWVAMSRARRGIAGGHGLAMAAFIISILYLVATIVGTVLAFKLLTFRGADGTITKEGYLPAGELRAGDCLDRPGRNPLFVKVQPCAFPHETELMARIPAVSSVPESQYAALCVPAFQAYVGIPPQRSQLVLSAIPVRASTFGDASGIACLVGQKDDAQIVGTLRGSRR